MLLSHETKDPTRDILYRVVFGRSLVCEHSKFSVSESCLCVCVYVERDKIWNDTR